ncbi:MAG: hypothetical protein M0Q01_15935 [Syntrophales bacterium]|nr:hypothetical protein [Syntrophales bacterium]
MFRIYVHPPRKGLPAAAGAPPGRFKSAAVADGYEMRAELARVTEAG